MPPTLANGKICYIEIPATDLDRSAAFYKTVFGWNVRRRGDGQSCLRRWRWRSERHVDSRPTAFVTTRPPPLHHGR